MFLILHSEILNSAFIQRSSHEHGRWMNSECRVQNEELRNASMPRLLFPSTGFTTADAAHYYRAIAKVLLPHLRDVPLSFKRYPDTIEGESFWEKDAPSFTPKFVQTFCVPRRSGPDIHYILANDVRTLTWLAESGGVELPPVLHPGPPIQRAASGGVGLDPGGGASIVRSCGGAPLLGGAPG